MDYEGTKRNVGPPAHPYGAACVAILERDGGMFSMCRGRASIFRDDYLGIRKNRVTHSLIGAHRALIFTEIRKGRPLFFRGWSALFRIRTFAPLPPLGAVSPRVRRTDPPVPPHLPCCAVVAEGEDVPPLMILTAKS